MKKKKPAKKLFTDTNMEYWQKMNKIAGKVADDMSADALQQTLKKLNKKQQKTSAA